MSEGSLATRVLGVVLLILGLGGAFVATATWWNGSLAARAAYDRILLGAANDIAASVGLRDGVPFVDLPVSAFQLLAQAPDDRVYYAVLDAEGATVTGIGGDAQVTPPPRSGTAPDFFDGSLQGEPARFVRVTRRFAERSYSGGVDILVGQTGLARSAMARALVIDALWPMFFAGALLSLIAWAVVRGALAPVETLARALAVRDPQDLTPVTSPGLPREVQVMIDAMNRFMGRIEAQVEAMQTLISDTAHQLRTPVAAIRVQAETAQAEPSGPARDRALDRLLRRTRSLGTLLDQLLSRAMVIHRTDSAPRLRVDLRDIALEIIETRDHKLLAPGKEVRLEIGEDEVPVLADAFSLTEAGSNLLSNALKHGTAPVTLGASLDGASALLWVRDGGKGPTAEVRRGIGDRFNRSAATQEDGTGLGLSIVAAVARAFGGRIDMQDDAEGFRMALVLPRAEGRP